MPALKIKVGSKNQPKLSAVEEILREYSHLENAEIEGIDVESGVSDQPVSLEEISKGAVNRARNAFKDCVYSIGIESGIVPLEQAHSGYISITCSAIYDGTNSYLGFSSGYDFPNKEVARLIVEEGMTLAEAVNAAGLVNDPHIGSHEGVISIWSNGRLNRKDLTKQALRTALIHIDIHE